MTEIDNAPMKEYVAMAVAYIIDTRVRMDRPPFMATATNIKNVVAKGLEETIAAMTKDGTLTEHVTLNEKAYEFTPPKTSKLNS